MNAVVVGFGQLFAGDDGIGILVARSLRGRGLEVVESNDPTILLSLLADRSRIVIVDAMVGERAPGEVFRVRHDELANHGVLASTHGIGIAEAIAVANVLHPGVVSAKLEIVGVAVGRAPVLGESMSPEVAASIHNAAALVEQLARGEARAPL